MYQKQKKKINKRKVNRKGSRILTRKSKIIDVAVTVSSREFFIQRKVNKVFCENKPGDGNERSTVFETLLNCLDQSMKVSALFFIITF